jgi:muconate cycloisomerase
VNIRFKRLQLKKKFPLAISRGSSSGSENLYVLVERNGIVGIGEAAPATGDAEMANRCECQLHEFVESHDFDQLSIADVVDLATADGLDPSCIAALDIALWDLTGKEANMPLYRLFGLARPTVATSITVGINPPDVIRERVPFLLRETGAKFLKQKLGNKEGGIEADKEAFAVAREEAAKFGVTVRVDANGGWNLKDAKEMLQWLSERGCDYVEQPLEQGAEEDLKVLFESRPIAIYCDESCRSAADVPPLADRCDGVNLKLMKTGGLTEALRLCATARAHGLKLMVGCMSEGSVAIGAAASISSLFTHIDLDSHLNLDPDSGVGLGFENGVVMPSDRPGHGVSLREGI